MKIGVVLPYDIVKAGGVKEIVLSQVAGLRQRGHDVTLITPRPRGHKAAPDPGTIFVGSSADWRSPADTTFQVGSALVSVIETLLEEQAFDVLHFHEPGVPMLSQQILSRSEAVNVGTFHSKPPETAMLQTLSRMITPYLKSILKDIDVLVAASPMAAEYIRTITDRPIAVVPVDIDLSLYKKTSKAENSPEQRNILYVGRLETRKGVAFLLRAFAVLQLTHPEAKLDILGDGTDRRKLEQLASQLGLKNVTFLGYRDTSEKLQRFQTADVYCSPAIHGEGFGKVLLEAMAVGVPTVAGNNPGYATVLKGFGAASLVNPKDTVDFARRLELFLYQDELRMLWRNWAASEVEQYSTEAMLDKYEAIYHDALTQKQNWSVELSTTR